MDIDKIIKTMYSQILTSICHTYPKKERILPLSCHSTMTGFSLQSTVDMLGGDQFNISKHTIDEIESGYQVCLSNSNDVIRTGLIDNRVHSTTNPNFFIKNFPVIDEAYVYERHNCIYFMVKLLGMAFNKDDIPMVVKHLINQVKIEHIESPPSHVIGSFSSMYEMAIYALDSNGAKPASSLLNCKTKLLNIIGEYSYAWYNPHGMKKVDYYLSNHDCESIIDISYDTIEYNEEFRLKSSADLRGLVKFPNQLFCPVQKDFRYGNISKEIYDRLIIIDQSNYTHMNKIINKLKLFGLDDSLINANPHIIPITEV